MPLADSHGSMQAKRAALAAFLVAALTPHDAAFGQAGRVEERLRLATLDGRDRADRVAIMGDPVRYARVVYEGHDPSAEAQRYVDKSGAPAHVFAVQVFYHYVDAAAFVDSSQADFDALTDGTDEAKPGLLTKLWDTPRLDVAGLGLVQLSRPDNVSVALTPLDLAGTEYVHFLEFTLTAF